VALDPRMKHGASGAAAFSEPQHSLGYGVLSDSNSQNVPRESHASFPKVGCVDRRRVEGH
jgi:hypothetical protein